jgi:Domain of unknown function (DUF5679)
MGKRRAVGIPRNLGADAYSFVSLPPLAKQQQIAHATDEGVRAVLGSAVAAVVLGREFCPRDRRDMVRGKPVTFTNGRPAIRGECATCGTPMSRIVQSFYESGVDCFPKA